MAPKTTIAKLDRELSAEEKEAFHREAEGRMKTFSYRKPPQQRAAKDVVLLGNTSLASVLVQVVRDGGENNLHYHTGSDTCWFVIKGHVRFYGVGNKVIGEFGPQDGIIMPGGARYWFEKTGPDELELLQVIAKDSTKPFPMAGAYDRVNLEPAKAWMDDDPNLQVYEKAPR
jgi:mannose-6-phosphate isomerase-like protein (cupin superfamily)